MKCKFAAAATLLLLVLSTWGWAQGDGAATYKAKCASCHGASGEGKGKTIAQDCDSCHQSLATDEASPEILKTLGIDAWISKPRKQ